MVCFASYPEVHKSFGSTHQELCSVKAEQSHGHLWGSQSPASPPCTTGSRCQEGRWCVWLPGSETPCGLQGEAGFWVWDVLEQSRACPTLQQAIHPHIISPPQTTFGLGCVGRPPPHRVQKRKISQCFKGSADSAGTGGEKVPLLRARERPGSEAQDDADGLPCRHRLPTCVPSARHCPPPG